MEKEKNNYLILFFQSGSTNETAFLVYFLRGFEKEMPAVGFYDLQLQLNTVQLLWTFTAA